MNKAVYKYPVKELDQLELPQGAEILDFGFQNRQLFVWALVDPDEISNGYRRIVLLGTGERTHELIENYRFICTFRQDEFVLHAFELTS